MLVQFAGKDCGKYFHPRIMEYSVISAKFKKRREPS
jgi:hypothetical protein